MRTVKELLDFRDRLEDERKCTITGLERINTRILEYQAILAQQGCRIDRGDRASELYPNYYLGALREEGSLKAYKEILEGQICKLTQIMKEGMSKERILFEIDSYKAQMKRFQEECEKNPVCDSSAGGRITKFQGTPKKGLRDSESVVSLLEWIIGENGKEE